MLVYWEEESSTSIVKASQIVEPLQPKKGSKSKVKWGKRVLPATVLEVGGKEKLKKMQTEFHKKQVCNEEVLEEITETAPPKKRKCAEASSSKNKKGKKEVTILCVTKPAEQVPVPSPPATTPAIDVEEPLPGTPSPEVPIQHTLPSNDAIALDLQKIYDELQAQRYTLQSLEDYVHNQFMELQAMQELQAAQIIELQGKLDKLECQQGPTRDESEECILSPAVGMNHREAFRDMENLPPQLYSTPASRCNQPALKSAADVIDSNQKLLQSTVKAGRLAVQLARYSYFGEDAMKISTVSSLPKEKLKEVKAGLYEVYRFNNQVEFEPLWQKCLIAIGKACQALRAKDSN